MPTMSNVVCPKCETFMRVKKNGVFVEEQDSTGGPYRIWSADLYGCPTCNAEVVTGFGPRPIVEHYQPEYQTWRERVTVVGR
jgi:hypothetical protein